MAEQTSVTATAVNGVINSENGTTDKIISFIQQQITSVAGSIKEYGPVAAHDIGMVKQWEAIGHLVTNTLVFVLFGVICYFCSKSWKKITDNYKTTEGNDSLSDAGFVFRFFITLIITILLFASISSFIYTLYSSDTYYMMDAISPNIAFVHFVMDKVSSVVAR